MPGRASEGGEFWSEADADVALQKFETLVNVVDDGIYQLDADGRFVAVNAAIVELLGYRREELLGAHVSAVLEDDDVDRVRRSISDALADGNTLDRTFELTVLPNHDDPFTCELQPSLLRRDGTFQGTVGIVRDVSDRARTEALLKKREQQLQRERDLTNQILETSPVGIQVLDGEGQITRMNRRAREILEIPGDEAPVHDPSDRTVYDEAGDEVPPSRHPFAESLRTDKPVDDRTHRVELPSGESRWLSVNAAPLYDDAGGIDRVVTTAKDVTDLKERERSLEERREVLASELKEIFGRITDGVIALDDDWEFTHVNEAAEEILDVTEDDLLGREIWHVFPEVAGTEFEERYRSAMATQEATSFEAYYEPHDRWYEEHVYPSETGVSIYFRDVTEHRERERELERSEQRYRTLAECFPNGIVTLFDDDLEYTLAAGQGFDRIPVEADDLEGNRASAVWPEETWADLEPAFRAALDGDERSVELAYAGREWVLHAVPISDDRGDVFTGMTMAQDITERKQYKRQLEATVDELQASNARLQQFAHAASHDLQEPLRMVSTYLQLLERRAGDRLDGDSEEYLEFAVDGADRMRGMIDGLLAYSRVETASSAIEPVELESVLEDALENLQVQVERNDTEVTSDELPPVMGDASQLLQVFQNLLDNAITYSGEEPPSIHVAAERREARSASERSGTAAENDGDRWEISVEDDGIGIPADRHDDVFSIFDRLHSHDEYSGSGIGLALCERIVERHDGDIWVESTPGEGSTFSFTLEAATE